METIFTVKNDDLQRLNPIEAVDFFRELVWAEATALGIGKNLINVPSAITVADGGIDAEIQNVQEIEGQGIIKQGLTRYQIKTGNFSLSNEAHIKDILFRKNTNELKPRVKSCLDNGGTFVVVLFGWDNPETEDNQLIDKFREKFVNIDPKYRDAKIEIWRQNNLIGFIKAFPSLALRVNSRDRTRFQTHRSWSQQDDMKKEFKAGETQKSFISKLQAELRRNDEAVHIRVYGEPGVGKTKIILEVTCADDLLPLVIYCDSASKFRESDLMNEILKDDNHFSAILVIDECDPDSRSYIWNKFKHLGSRIKLISIYNEFDETSGNISYFDTPLLNKEQIISIIQEYGIFKYSADRWSELCSGCPRVAHVIGWNLKNNPEDLLKPPDTVNVWDRYIVGKDDPDNQIVQQRQVVLRHIALFKRFGYGQSVVLEARTIGKIVEQADPLLSWSRFQELIRDLKARKILQGENTLYITPKALHIKLWIDWWNIYGNGFFFDEFSKNLTPTLLEWFYEMFKYAAESEVASKIAKELLGEKGPFQNDEYFKTTLGARFFLSLTEADPKSALGCLKRTVGLWRKEELLQFTIGRREIIWALEKIAMWREMFADAAKLLLVLGEAENEAWSNNASGVFAELFSPGYGQVAPTEASPQERFLILKEALESSSKERRALALRACNQALESWHFVRTIGSEHQGLRKEPQLWMPKTWGELFDAYRQVWQLLRERLDYLPEDERQQAVGIFLQRARGLGRIQNLADMVLDTVHELIQKPYVDKKKVLAEVLLILHYESKELPTQTRQRLEQLKDTLTGHDFSSLMKRYVGMDILEDKFDEDGKYVDQTLPRIEELARQAIEHKDLLQSELDWLIATDVQNGYRFGYELGKGDNNFSLLSTLLDAQREGDKNSSVHFISGYFRAIFEKDQERWENQLDILAKDIKMNMWVPELSLRSGISDRAALRILELVEKDVIKNISHLRMFCFGGAVQNLSEDVFKTLIEFLIRSLDPYAIPIALNLYHSYYVFKDSKHILPKELTLRLLTHQLLFQRPETGRYDQMENYHWTEIGKAFAQFYPEKSLELADKMLQYFGEENTILDGFHSETKTVLNEITRQYPHEVWGMIIKFLGPPVDSRAFHINKWLQGGEFFEEEEGILPIIPLEAIWKWVDENIGEHARYLATFVPKSLFREKEKICLVRELLIRYGSRKDVRDNLMANFSTEGWRGPASLHYQSKKQMLLDFGKDEQNDDVKSWIDEYLSYLDQEIEQTKIEEERNDLM